DEPPAPSVLTLLSPWMRFRGETEMALNVRQLPGPILCSICGQRISSDHLLVQLVDGDLPLPTHLLNGLFRQAYAGHRLGMQNPLKDHDKVIHREHCHVQIGSSAKQTHLSLLVPRPPLTELTSRRPERVRLLLVDDDPRIANYLATVLREQGYDVIVYNDPIYAHALLRREPVDLLITDVDMPEMSGPTLAGIARSLQPGIQIIFCSGDPHCLDGQLEHIRGFHEEDWSQIDKPVDATLLIRQVNIRLQSAIGSQSSAADNVGPIWRRNTRSQSGSRSVS
ncbi:MAG: response regulator, partial [Pseudomonadota bacterium]